MKSVLAPVIIAMGAAGFATAAEAQEPTITETQIADHAWQIHADGAPYSIIEDVDEAALAHAADLVLEQGGTHFVVLRRNSTAQTTANSSTRTTYHSEPGRMFRTTLRPITSAYAAGFDVELVVQSVSANTANAINASELVE